MTETKENSPKKKKRPYLTLFIILFQTVLLLELVSAVFIFAKSRNLNDLKKHVPIVDLLQFRSVKQSEVTTYRDRKLDYFIFDPTLGVRLRPDSHFIALDSTEDGKPRLSTTKKLKIDHYGYISNTVSSEDSRDYGKVVHDPETYRILISGGSTVAGWGASENSKTWPAVLEQLITQNLALLEKPYRRVAVINSGVPGYGISQEIKRFVDETIYLKPHMVIAFNGINERWGYSGNPVSYTLRGDDNQIIRKMNYAPTPKASLFLPYFSLARNLLNEAPQSDRLFGYHQRKYIVENDISLYLEKVQQFRGLCESSGIEFFHVFQPVMGGGKKLLTGDENNLLQFFGSEFYGEPWEEYQKRLSTFYSEVKPYLESPWQIDMSNLFDDEVRRVYEDPRHYNDLGQKIVANAILDLIASDGLLRSSNKLSRNYPTYDVTVDLSAESTHFWGFWYERLEVICTVNESIYKFSCERPISGSSNTPWKCIQRNAVSNDPVYLHLNPEDPADKLGAILFSSQLGQTITRRTETANLQTANQKEVQRLEQERLNTEAKEAFTQSTDSVFNLNSEKKFGELKLRNLELKNKEGDDYSLTATSQDPIIYLPELKIAKNSGLVVKIVTSVPKSMNQELFYMRDGQSEYSREQRLIQELSKGENSIYFLLAADNITGRIRIDPINEKDDFILYSIEVRTIER